MLHDGITLLDARFLHCHTLRSNVTLPHMHGAAWILVKFVPASQMCPVAADAVGPLIISERPFPFRETLKKKV